MVGLRGDVKEDQEIRNPPWQETSKRGPQHVGEVYCALVKMASRCVRLEGRQWRGDDAKPPGYGVAYREVGSRLMMVCGGVEGSNIRKGINIKESVRPQLRAVSECG